MGGHGGLNILPQKRWNVYNFDNREKVRRDEEEAAKEEQLKREQARKRDTEFRLERLRTAKGLAPSIPPPPESSEPEVAADPGHINLFEGIKIFDPVKKEGGKEIEGEDSRKKKKAKKEEVRVVGPEDEKYRLGYGVAGKGVQLPWYVRKPIGNVDDDVDDGGSDGKGEKKKKQKKTLEELREERVKRERREKDRERALILEKRKSERDVYRSSRFSRR
ncbi:uncharacterized protein LOC130714062 isoform X2 [Lotus japonicus]|uniref:uncharacterized protein LOC130714062 isoform X2 n=1 Tax=Lotus japonicus TaxID=34305 RepID=UPI0025893323|nr:uncharacterized protein LOC130714062 isoform X2 [Lotus japonicus]